MVKLSLPQNSRVRPGKTWPVPSGATRLKTFNVYRWNPEDGENPRLDTYQVDLDKCEYTHFIISDRTSHFLLGN